MYDIKGTTEGGFEFSTRCLEEDEKKFYGIFISHSSTDNEKYLYPLREAMISKGLHPLCDRDFLEGGDDYQSLIERRLDCYAAVIIVTPSSLDSDWVNFEIGMLTAKKIPIFLYDPESCLIVTPYEEYHDVYLSRLDNVYRSLDKLMRALVSASPYSEMFTEETAFLDCDTFRERMRERVETVIATVESNVFDELYEELSQCKIGILIPNFGMFYPDHADGEHCYARRYSPLENRMCPQSNTFCALSAPRVLGDENKECVLLNHILYNGRVLKKGEADHRGRVTETGAIIFHMPLHKLYGTEFKFIVDVPDTLRCDSISSALDKAGLNPTGSISMYGGRIYLSLPERRAQGLFRLNHEFTNNFLCPYAARRKR